ncbi:O-antigen ligase family protein [Rickettsiales bacterium]|nr:O-antigen ligase family protein [Rickettsiales bacterium]
MIKAYYYILIFVTATCPLVAVFSGVGVATIFAIAAIIPIISLIKDKKFNLLFNAPAKKICVIFLIYALMTYLWSASNVQIFNLWIRLLLLYIGTIVSIEYLKEIPLEKLNVLLISTISGVIIAMIAVNFESLTNGIINSNFIRAHKENYEFKIYDLNRGLSYIAVSIWMIFGYFIINKKYFLGILLLLISFITIFPLESSSTSLGLICAFLAYFIVRYSGNYWLYIISTGVIIITISTPIVISLIDVDLFVDNLPKSLPLSAEHRLYIWDYAATKAQEKSLFGWGLNSSRTFQELPDIFHVSRGDPNIPGNRWHLLPLHPHNNIMQIWLELGATGLLLYIGLLLSFLKQIDKYFEYDINLKSASVATLISYIAISFTGYGAWQNWWIASVCLIFIFNEFIKRISQNQKI